METNSQKFDTEVSNEQLHLSIESQFQILRQISIPCFQALRSHAALLGSTRVCYTFVPFSMAASLHSWRLQVYFGRMTLWFFEGRESFNRKMSWAETKRCRNWLLYKRSEKKWKTYSMKQLLNVNSRFLSEKESYCSFFKKNFETISNTIKKI